MSWQAIVLHSAAFNHFYYVLPVAIKENSESVFDAPQIFRLKQAESFNWHPILVVSLYYLY